MPEYHAAAVVAFACEYVVHAGKCSRFAAERSQR